MLHSDHTLSALRMEARSPAKRRVSGAYGFQNDVEDDDEGETLPVTPTPTAAPPRSPLAAAGVCPNLTTATPVDNNNNNDNNNDSHDDDNGCIKSASASPDLGDETVALEMAALDLLDATVGGLEADAGMETKTIVCRLSADSATENTETTTDEKDDDETDAAAASDAVQSVATIEATSAAPQPVVVVPVLHIADVCDTEQDDEDEGEGQTTVDSSDATIDTAADDATGAAYDESGDIFDVDLPAPLKDQLGLAPGGTVKSKRGSIRGVMGGVASRLDLMKDFGKEADETPEEQMARMIKEEERVAAERVGGKIVIYTTSMSAIPKTKLACDRLRKLLRNMRVHFEERDIFLEEKFAAELQLRLPSSEPVPQLFLNGEHIGDDETVLTMNERGQLEKLFKNVPRLRDNVAAECRTCGGSGFLPCEWCHGSKRSITSVFGTLKCTACNVNGLMQCRSCMTASTR